MANIVPENPTTQTRTYIASPQRKMTLRVIWLLVVVTVLILYVSSIPNAYSTYLNSPNWAVGYGEVLTELGVAPAAFAAFFTGIGLMSLFIAIVFSTAVFSTRSDDWMALLVSLTVIMMAAFANQAVHLNNTSIGGFFMGIATTLIFSTMLLFPDGHFQPRFSRYVLIVLIPVFFISAFFTSQLLAGRQLTPTQLAISAIGQSTSLLGVVAQAYRYRYVASPMQRQQTKFLVLGGFAVVTTMFLFLFAHIYPPFRTPILFPDTSSYSLASFVLLVIFAPLVAVSINLIPVSFGFAVIRYRLWNIDIVINRSLVYVMQTFGILFVFSLGFFLLQTLLKVVLGGEQDTLAAVVSTGIVVALFNPVRKLARRNVDRYLFGLRFDLDQLEAAHATADITHPGKLSGTQLGDYEVLDVIGKGGMGEVYKCSKDGQVFAAKILLPEFAHNPEMLIRFQREAQSGMELIEHDNIANIYAIGESNNIHYMVMEFIDGQDLSKIMRESGKLDFETTVHIAKNICSALQAAHEHDYVHRDIKPSNIMIRENGEAVLMDFGVMKMQDATTGITGTGAIGTIDYMAPEQIISAKTVDRRADIYALGVMLYQMITGEKPFTGGPAQVMFAHLQQPPPDVRDIDNSIPIELAEAIDKAMAKNPDDRFQTAREFGTALNI